MASSTARKEAIRRRLLKKKAPHGDVESKKDEQDPNDEKETAQ